MWQVGVEVRQDMTPTVLRKKARSEKDGANASRLLGIANILDGMDRGQAARAVGMTGQTLRDWVRRYNAEGIDGLRNRPKGRPERALTQEQEQEINTLVTSAPDGPLVRWRCADLQKEIKERYDVVLHERTIGKLMRRLGFRRLTVRPLHPEADLEAQEAFKKTSRPRLPKSSPIAPKANTSSSGSKTKRALDKKER